MAAVMELSEKTVQEIKHGIDQARGAIVDAVNRIDAEGEAKVNVWFLRWALLDTEEDLCRAEKFLLRAAARVRSNCKELADG